MADKRSAAKEQRREFVISTATDVFLRYGYSRTTMADLADAAKLSRPGLYEVFPNKEELFSEVIRGLNRAAIEQFRREMPKLKNLRSKLQRFCQEWGTHGLQLAAKHPDAKDLFNMEIPAVREMYEEFIAFLTDLVISETSRSKVQIGKMVYNLVFSLLGLEAAAHSVSEMKTLIDLQVDVFLSALANM